MEWLFQTKQEVILLASSGTGAMESAVTNLFSRGDRVVVVDGGKFGERFGEIAKAYGVEMIAAFSTTNGNGRAIRSRRRSQGVVDRARLLDHVSRGQERQRRLRPQSHEFLDILQ